MASSVVRGRPGSESVLETMNWHLARLSASVSTPGNEFRTFCLDQETETTYDGFLLEKEAPVLLPQPFEGGLAGFCWTGEFVKMTITGYMSR